MRTLDSSAISILQGWIEGKTPTEREQEALIARELLDKPRANAFGIDRHNCQQLIEARSQLFTSAYQDVANWCKTQGIVENFSLLWTLWLPLAINLAEIRQELGRTPIQGILGGQGTGKSSLTSILNLLLKHLGYSTATISIDDLYKTYGDRQKLQQADPRLIWRGPPGTHDVKLGIKLLDRCLQPDCDEPILIPRFDKSLHNGQGDRIEPEVIPHADIVLFEGWFVGVRPVAEARLEHYLKEIFSPEEIQFAKDNNQRLESYLPLWDKLDRLLVLYPEDYRFSKQWRQEAEHKMIAQGKTGMTDAEIEEFVNYFWRSLHPELYIKPLINNPYLVDLVVEIKSDRSYSKIYQPYSNDDTD